MPPKKKSVGNRPVKVKKKNCGHEDFNISLNDLSAQSLPSPNASSSFTTQTVNRIESPIQIVGGNDFPRHVMGGTPITSTPKKTYGGRIRQAVDLLLMPIRDDLRTPPKDNGTPQMRSSSKGSQISAKVPNNPNVEMRQVID